MTQKAQVQPELVELTGKVDSLTNALGALLDLVKGQQLALNELQQAQTAPTVLPVSMAPERLMQAQELEPSTRREIEGERHDTRARLTQQPRVTLYIEEEHAIWYGGLKVWFGPVGETLEVPLELAQAYQAWRRSMGEIGRFKKKIDQVSQGTGLIPLQALSQVVGHEDD